MNETIETSFGTISYEVDPKTYEGAHNEYILPCPNCGVPMHLVNIFKDIVSPTRDDDGASFVCSICGSSGVAITLRKRLPIL
jgi:hypothetical protein